jgi:hypothetical protein
VRAIRRYAVPRISVDGELPCRLQLFADFKVVHRDELPIGG